MSEGQKWVCQEYIADPYLVDGFKFDTRIYVLVTSVDPLRIWLHKDGFLRLCTTKYEKPNVDNYTDTRMHLTNYAINKSSENFVKNNSKDVMYGKGSKRHLEWFKDHIEL